MTSCVFGKKKKGGEEEKTYLPCRKARCAHQMPTRFNLHIFVILCTDFTKLKRGTHFTVQFVLFLKKELL